MKNNNSKKRKLNSNLESNKNPSNKKNKLHHSNSNLYPALQKLAEADGINQNKVTTQNKVLLLLVAAKTIPNNLSLNKLDILWLICPNSYPPLKKLSGVAAARANSFVVSNEALNKIYNSDDKGNLWNESNTRILHNYSGTLFEKKADPEDLDDAQKNILNHYNCH